MVIVEVVKRIVCPINGVVQPVANARQVWVHGEIYTILLLIIVDYAKSLILHLLVIPLLLLSNLGSVVEIIEVDSLLAVEGLWPDENILGRLAAHAHVMLVSVSISLWLLKS